MNQSLAHPLGANFKGELVFKYDIKLAISLKTMIVGVGLDISMTKYF